MIAWLQEYRGDLVRAALAIAGLTLVALLTRPAPVAPLDTYSAGDVRSGGYAAFEELLQREGVAVEHFARRPIELDGTIDTLIDAYGVEPPPGDVRLDADTRALAGWVRRGGRLVLLGHIDALDKQERTLLKRPERKGARVVRVRLGRGAVDYVTDPRIFSNGELLRDGNARLAYLLGRPRAGRIVAFDETLHGALIERSWLATLGVPARVGLAGSVLAILIALAGGALRLGPPVTLRAVREPASDEFIAAVAALYRRAHARRDAIALLAGGADGPSASAVQLRQLRERQTPTDADLIRSAALALVLRKEHG